MQHAEEATPGVVIITWCSICIIMRLSGSWSIVSSRLVQQLPGSASNLSQLHMLLCIAANLLGNLLPEKHLRVMGVHTDCCIPILS